jgi:hypothetical protein
MIKMALLVIGIGSNGSFFDGYTGSSYPSATIMPNMEYCEAAKRALIKKFPQHPTFFGRSDGGFREDFIQCVEVD